MIPPTLALRFAGPNKRTRGFTLVELLLAAVLLGVLLLLAFSGIKAVRLKTEDGKCVNNLRQLGIAIHAYAADNRGMIPPRNLGLYRTTNKPPSNLRCWPQRLINLGYVKNLDIFFCPSFFPRNNQEARRKADAGAAETYGMRMWTAPGTGWAEMREEEKPLSSIREPADFFLLADSVWTSEGWESQGYGLIPESPTQMVHLRHGTMANALFADGHVARKPGAYFEELGLPDRQQAYCGDKNRPFYTSSQMTFP